MTPVLDEKSLSKLVRASRVDGISCLFASVSGPGISPDFGPLNLGDRSPVCLGLGLTTNLGTIAHFSTKGMQLKVPSGPQRTIRIYGVQSTLTDCDNKPLSEVFGSRRPAIYELGKATADAFVDTKVVVHASSDGSSAKDIVAACDSTKPAPTAARDTKVVAVVNISGNYYLRYFKRDSALNLVMEDSDMLIPFNSYNQLALSPDGRDFYYYLPAPTPVAQTFIKRVHLDPLGAAISDVGYELNVGNSFRWLTFSSNSAYLYLSSSVSLYQYNRGVKKIEAYSTPGCPLPLNFGPYANSRRTYYFDNGQFSFRTEPFTGDLLCDGELVLYGGPLPFNVVKVVPGKPGVFYFMGTLNGATALASYRQSASGLLAYYGSSPGFSSTYIDFAVQPQGSFLYISDGVNQKLIPYLLNPDGSIGTSGNSLFTPTIRSLSMDPSGKSVFAIIGTGFLRQYAIDAAGDLTQVDNVTPLPNDGVYSSVMAVPVY